MSINDGDSRLPRDVKMITYTKYYMIDSGSHPESHAKRSAVKMACLANGYRSNDMLRVSDRTEDPNSDEDDFIHPNMQFNFEPFHIVASKGQTGKTLTKHDMWNSDDLVHRTPSSLHVGKVKSCIDELTDQLDNEQFTEETHSKGTQPNQNWNKKLTEGIEFSHLEMHTSGNISSPLANASAMRMDAALDGQTYKQMLQSFSTQLENKCNEYDKILSQNNEQRQIDDEIIGNIQSAIGQARLLLTKKMQQFDRLCQANISGPSDPSEHTTTNDDLAGYWDMVKIQIDKCLNAFTCIDTIRDNKWKNCDSTETCANPKPRCAVKSPLLKQKPSATSSRPLAKGNNKHHIQLDSSLQGGIKPGNPRGQNESTGEVHSPQLRELIRQRRLLMRKAADSTMTNGVGETLSAVGAHKLNTRNEITLSNVNGNALEAQEDHRVIEENNESTHF